MTPLLLFALAALGYLCTVALILGALLRLHQPREAWASAALDILIACGWPLWWLGLPFWIGGRLMARWLRKREAKPATCDPERFYRPTTERPTEKRQGYSIPVHQFKAVPVRRGGRA